MKANVQHGTHNAKAPAGMFGTGTELVTHNNRIYGLQNGSMKPFNELPLETRHALRQAYIDDVTAHPILKEMDCAGVDTGFTKWIKCMFGNLDGVADFEDGQLQPDAFNAACQSTECPFRGKLCGRQSAITTEDFKTLKCIVSGYSDKQAADRLCLSTTGMKSRRESLKRKLNVINSAELAAHAAQLGITPFEEYASVKNA